MTLEMRGSAEGAFPVYILYKDSVGIKLYLLKYFTITNVQLSIWQF